MTEETSITHNRDEIYRRYFDRIQRDYLKLLVCDDVIEEHKNKLRGQHSEPLERLLIYFRRAPLAGKYAIRRDEQSKTFTIIIFSGIRGSPPRAVDDQEYGSVEEAYHGVFLKRIRDLMEC